jgi:hypothetical protein
MLFELIGWIGAAGLMAAPFIIDSVFGKLLAVFSLGCLVIQAFRLKAYNLVAANSVSIVGYLYVLYF